MLKSELNLACSAVLAALQALSHLRPDAVSFDLSTKLPRELKAVADQVLENVIVDHLRVSGLDILSEESGKIVSGGCGNSLCWVVDPLDGTVNYVRGLGPCSVSVALCRGRTPIVGVIGEFPTGKLAWGGVGCGAFLSGKPIQVSKISERRQAVICTGFPSRFEFDSTGLDWIASTMGAYAKVRMLGSASLSLLHVAKGAAEVYAERNIMVWDVAAGLAIVQGAGGDFSILKNQDCDSYNVFASNGLIGDC